MKEQSTKAQMFRKPQFWVAIALVLCLIGSFGAYFVQSSGGSVEIRQNTLESAYGPINLLVYKPKTASVEDPAPCVIVCSGMEDNLQKQGDIAMELARRGCVVVAMDQVSHGNTGEFTTVKYITNDEGQYYNVDTETFVDSVDEATRFNAHGMIDVVEYIWTNMGFVDHDRIGVTGHSQGGVNATRTMRYYHYQESVLGNVNKIHAMFSQSCNELVLPGEMDGLDVGYVVGTVDEIFVITLNMLTEKGITTLPEVLQYHANDLIKNGAMYWAEPADVADVNYEFGTYVYDDNGNIRVFNINSGDHCVQHWHPHAIECVTTFFMESFDMDPGIADSSQLWQLKEFFNGVGLVGFFMFACAFAGLLLTTKFFSSLKATEETLAVATLKTPKSKKDIIIYIAGILILGFLPGLLFTQLFGATWLADSDLFPLSTFNNFTMFVFAAGLICAAYVAVVNLIFYRKEGYTPRSFGVSISNGDKSNLVHNIVKTIILGVVVVAATYSLVFISTGVLNTDYRFFELGINVFTVHKFSHFPAYIIFWLVWAAGVTLAVNTNFRNGFSEKLTLTVTVLANCIGLGILLIPYFVSFYQNGTPGSDLALLDLIRLFPMIPCMGIATVLARRLYKKTGNIWLATLIIGLLIGLATLSNSAVTYYFVMG